MMYEILESRALLSAVPFPSVVGSYVGTYDVSTGASGTINLSVYSQVKGKFFAISTQSVGPSVVMKGTISKSGAIHFLAKPNALGWNGHGSGKFANGVFNLTEVIRGPGTHFSATIAVSSS